LLADLASIALTLTLVIQGFGLYSLALGLALRAAVAVTSNGASCLWVTRRKLGLRLRWAREEATSLWRDSYYQFFTSIAVRLQTHADPFLVGLVLGPQSAAIYALTVRAHETVRLISGQLGRALTPSLAHLFGDGQVARFRQMLQTTLMVHTLQAAVGMGGVLAFNRAFVGLWIGPEMYAGDLVTSLFACFGVVAALSAAPYDALFAMGRFARLCLVAWVATLVRIPLVFALLQLGLWGVPAAALVAVVIRTVLLQRVITAEMEFPAAVLRSMAAHAVRIGLPPLLLGAAVLSLGRTADGWIALALGGAGYLVLAMLAVGVADRELFRTLRQEARSTLPVLPRR
jgi:O-antigen/teichoic acid export membrane protein